MHRSAGGFRKRFLSCAVLSIALGMLPLDALADVVFHDDVVISGREIALKAETKGTFLFRGGEIVEFFVDGKPVGKSLSGGDGVAFKRFVPSKEGLYKIRVRSGKASDSGVLLALRKKSRVVCIDVEGGLSEGMFFEKVHPGSAKAVRTICKRYPVVFLQTGLAGVRTLKSWLKKNNFPELPVLAWRGGEVFGEIHQGGLVIKAVVGRPDVVNSAIEYKPLAFSFHPLENGESVEDWDEIEKRLR